MPTGRRVLRHERGDRTVALIPRPRTPAEKIDAEISRLRAHRKELSEFADVDTLRLFAELTQAIDELLVLRFELGPSA
jgi:hypothetical protein